jgi:hypothetical protein
MPRRKCWHLSRDLDRAANQRKEDALVVPKRQSAAATQPRARPSLIANRKISPSQPRSSIIAVAQGEGVDKISANLDLTYEMLYPSG